MRWRSRLHDRRRSYCGVFSSLTSESTGRVRERKLCQSVLGRFRRMILYRCKRENCEVMRMDTKETFARIDEKMFDGICRNPVLRAENFDSVETKMRYACSCRAKFVAMNAKASLGQLSGSQLGVPGLDESRIFSRDSFPRGSIAAVRLETRRLRRRGVFPRDSLRNLIPLSS